MKYTKSHEWVSLQGEKAVIGITNHAQRELGEVVYVDLPKVGQQLQAGEVAAVLESTKAAADVYAPVAGQVVAVNEKLVQDSGLVNRAAQEEGWLFILQPADVQQIQALLTEEEYCGLCGQ